MFCTPVQIQEIKATSSKAKTQDMVAIRHSVSTSDQQRTTMILLCEDGSLRIYMASAEHTGYWMSPEFQPSRSVYHVCSILFHWLYVVLFAIQLILMSLAKLDFNQKLYVVFRSNDLTTYLFFFLSGL